MSFTTYAGTPFAPCLLPIIPADAPLTSGSTIPEKSKGKTPGFRTDHGEWYGHADWTKHALTGDPKRQLKLFRAWDNWYPGGRPIIGISARLFPAIDIDIDNLFAETARDIAFDIFGPTIVRGRPNSKKMLLMYRLQQPGYFIIKQRRDYCDADGNKFAVEILGKGQQYLIEGRHPSGVDYAWVGGATPLIAGTDELPEITPDQVNVFVRKLDEVFGFGGIKPVRPKGLGLGGSTGSGEERPVGLDHPDRAPSIDMVIDALSYLSANDPEFESRADWEVFIRALKTAVGGDEGFYDEHYLPWNLEHADNEETDIRKEWDSHKTSRVGWSYVASLAGAKGYTGEVLGYFDSLGDAENRDSGNDDEGAKKGARAGASNARSGQPSAPRSQDSELVIANKFIDQHARKDWIYVPTSRTGGVWKTFENGMWVDGHGGALLAVAEECAKVGDRIRTSASATQAQLNRARDLSGAHTAQNVLSLVRNSRRMTVPRPELDSHAMLMGVPGGYVDADGNLREPDPSLLITKCAGVAPLRGGPCPQWESLVRSLTNDDPDTLSALRSALGYTMTGSGEKQVFFFLHGLDGGEGKTTFLQIISRVMGSYATMLPDGAFAVSRNDNRFAFGGLEGSWFVFSNEIEEGEDWATASLKDKTGSGTTWLERKGVDGMAVPIHYGLWFQGNHLPRFRKPDPALRRRMIIFECRKPFPKEAAIAGFADRVFSEEGPAILDWLLRARVDYLEHGLILPQAMEDARNEYLSSQDTMGQFIGDCCTFDPQAETPLDDLYDHWQFWRLREGQEHGRAGTRETFSKSLVNHELCRQAKVSRDRPRNAEGNKIRVFRGIRLTDGTRDEPLEAVQLAHSNLNKFKMLPHLDQWTRRIAN